VSKGIFLTAGQALLGALNGYGYFADDFAHGNLSQFWFFTTVLASAGLLLALIIYQRQQTEEALRQSETCSRALLNAIPDMMFRLNRAGVFLDFKANQLSDLAVAPEQFLGKTIAEVMPPNLTRQVEAGIARTLDTGQVQTFKYQLALPHGLHTFEARLIQSGPDEIITLVRNITERKQAEVEIQQLNANLERRVAERTDELEGEIRQRRQTEATLAASERHYRQLFESIDDSIMLYSEQGKFLDCNDVTCQRLGYNRAEFLVLSAADLVDPADHGLMRQNQSRLWTRESTVVESAHQTKDGRVIPVEINPRRIEYEGQPAILAVVRDISARKQAEEELERYRSHLEELVKQRTVELETTNLQLHQEIAAKARL
jgi:PAS domain S-box-containing protein